MTLLFDLLATNVTPSTQVLPALVPHARTGTCRTLRAMCCAILLISGPLLGCRSSGIRADRLPLEYRHAARNQNHTLNFAGVTTPGASDSVIAPSDLLKITVATNSDKENADPIQARVADDGTVEVPVIGPVPVAGLEAFDASQNIKNVAIQRGMYRQPLITVEIEKKAVNRVTILGAVTEPGVHELPRGGSNLLSALAASGGMTDEASTEVEIVRQPQIGVAAVGTTNAVGSAEGLVDEDLQLASYQGLGQSAKSPSRAQSSWSGSQTLRINLAEQRPMASAQFQLSDRDIVRVVPRKKEVIHVAGLVRDPGQFEIPFDQDLRLVDAIALAGGRSSPVADKITIIRQLNAEAEPIVIQASLAGAKQHGLENLRLSSGDSINVEQTPVTAVVDAFSRFFRLSLGVASNTVF